MKELKIKLQGTHNADVHITTISRALRSLKYVMKELRLAPAGRNTPELIEARLQWVTNLMANRPANRANVIYIDETGYHLNIRRSRGRARKGQIAWIETPNSRGTNITVIAAMNENGLLFSEALLGPVNTEKFSLFLCNLFLRVARMEGDKWIIMDNCSFHHSEVVKKLFEGNPGAPTGRTLVFLPPYSPFLNPIENLFSKWKALVKSCRPSSRETLIQSIRNKIGDITPANCQLSSMVPLR